MRGGDGVPQPAAGADFFGIFFFFRAIFICFMGIRRALRYCEVGKKVRGFVTLFLLLVSAVLL